MTATLRQSLPKDPRVQALPLRQDLHWEIQKYLSHPTADLVKEDFCGQYKRILEKRYAMHLRTTPLEVLKAARVEAQQAFSFARYPSELNWDTLYETCMYDLRSHELWTYYWRVGSAAL
jgi:hypothetical protein